MPPGGFDQDTLDDLKHLSQAAGATLVLTDADVISQQPGSRGLLASLFSARSTKPEWPAHLTWLDMALFSAAQWLTDAAVPLPTLVGSEPGFFRISFAPPIFSLSNLTPSFLPNLPIAPCSTTCTPGAEWRKWATLRRAVAGQPTGRGAGLFVAVASHASVHTVL